MPTASGHTRAILASKVTGTNVYNTKGEKIGHVEDVVLDKTSNEIMFAVLGFGGFLGIGEKFHAVPWSLLDYDMKQEGYVVNLDRKVLEAAPTYRLEDLTRDDGAVRTKSREYYAPYI
jgi:sporulation protein YlmC with PRC-barrel domain